MLNTQFSNAGRLVYKRYLPTSATPDVTDQLVECYRQVFAAEPWSEWVKFVLNRDFDNFELLPAGQEIGVDGDEIIRAKKASYILFAHSRQKAGEEGFLLGEVA